ncbi:PEP-CTERM sorting domain-containing protein [Ottowia sp.]|uniref:PEP-CTERM sorting domain-containing protein n=1 Tax=Ottowia sp. TaxID=1898956 RepID=UPI003A84AC97
MHERVRRWMGAGCVWAGVFLTAGAQAALLDAPVPSNATVVKGGLEWAWANPLPASSGLDLSYQSTNGWRLPTAAELANAPLATEFMYGGANVPLGGIDPVSNASFSVSNAALTGNAACAAPYFSSSYPHCDWQDGLGQPQGPWAGMTGAAGFAEQLVVRRALVTGGAGIAAVPTLGLPALIALALGLAGMVGWRTKKN